MDRARLRRFASNGGAQTWTPSPFGFHPGDGSHFEQEKLLDAPGMRCEPGGHGRSGRRTHVFGGTQFVMDHTPVIDTADEVHARLQRLQTMSGMTTSARQGGQAFAE